jgi:hypothetical protein
MNDSSSDEPNTESIKKILYLNDNSSKPVIGVGVLFYKKVGTKVMLLVVEADAKYADIGGKINNNDSDIPSSLSRILEEITNGVITYENGLINLKNAQYIYISSEKYVIYFVEANSEEKKLIKEDFDNSDKKNGSFRKIGWKLREDLINEATVKYKLNSRLKSKNVINTISAIGKQISFTKTNLFKNN